MIIYSSERFIKAHEDINISYKNHTFDRYVREAICNNCGKIIGEQTKYPDFEERFHFVDIMDKSEWKYCPVCGTAL